MNVNDRIALELGRAQMGRIIAEVQLEGAQAAAKTLQEQVAALEAKVAEAPPPCGRTPREVEDMLRERGLDETVCPDDHLSPGEHSWEGTPTPDPSS